MSLLKWIAPAWQRRRSRRLVVRAMVAAAAIGLLGGCAHGPAPAAALGPTYGRLVISAEACKAPSAASVGHAGAAEDLRQLGEILARGYAGYELAASAGLAWDAQLAALGAQVAEAPEPLPLESLRQAVLESLRATRDGELAVGSRAPTGEVRWGRAGRHLDAYTTELLLEADGAGGFRVRTPKALAGATLIDCQGRKAADLVRPSFAGGPAARLVLLRDRTPDDLVCSFRLPGGATRSEALALHRFRLAQGVTDGPAFSRGELEGVPVLRLSALSGSPSLVAEFVDSAVELRRAPAIVLDARQNLGGAEAPVRQFFTRLTDGPLRRPVSEDLWSEVTLAGQANSARCALAEAGDDPATRGLANQRLAAAERALRAAERERPQGGREWKKTEGSDAGTAPQPFRAPLVLIVDAGCGGACELLASYVRQLPGGLVVGENTAGVGVLAEPRRFRLPRTGLLLEVPSRHLHDADAARAARPGQGTQPDLWIDARDPLPEAVALTRCLGEPSCASALGRSASR